MDTSYYTDNTEYDSIEDADVLLAAVTTAQASLTAAVAAGVSTAADKVACDADVVSAAASAATATTQAATATTQATNAATSATASATSATNSASSATASATSATNSASSATSSAASWNLFNAEYLGAKAADPTLNNTGGALAAGMMYWNTATSNLKIYTGSVWNVYSASAGDMLKATYDPDNDGIIALAQGGTGASTAAGARTNLALVASATTDTTNASNISSGTLAAARGGAGALTGILKANGAGTVSAATSGTDYAPATSGSGVLKGNGAGGTSTATAGTDYVAPGTTSALTAGFTSASVSAGTKSTGTYTFDPTAGAVQHATNGGAHTFAPPATNGAWVLDYVNNASAGAITTSGWTKVDGDAFDTTNTHAFRCYLSNGNQGSHMNVKRMV